MAVMNVNPTRMQLSKLKKQLTTAVRGHKMLKDKRDELMRQFLDLVRETRELRDRVESELERCNAHFVNAGAVMSKEALDA
ncbi:MAG: V-type ATP synthase subunit D, partial [Ruminococcus sp.]|nr:V-type ATP synthase subunit D [Ruminococcus sp.]